MDSMQTNMLHLMGLRRDHEDGILCDILSRLPARDAARTSALSTRWRRLWRSVPLVLADAHLKHTGPPPPPVSEIDQVDGLGGVLRRAVDGTRDVASAVSRALAAHPGPFRSVHVTCTRMDAHHAELALWLQLLAAKGVQELVLVYQASKLDAGVRLPATLFRCSSLTCLYIGFLRFPDVATIQRAGAFPHLRELGLCSLVMGVRDLALLLDRCPVLENLEIVGHRELVRLRVASHSLRCVELCESVVEEITVEHAARLERLMFWEICGAGTKVSPKNMVRSVRVLGIQCETTIHKPPGMLNPKFLQQTGPIDCLQKHIKKVIIREFRIHRSELDFVKFIAERGQVLEKIVIVLAQSYSSSADRLRSSMRTFMASVKLANEDCKVIVCESPFPSDGTAWCFQGAFNMSKDPFDVSQCSNSGASCRAA
ncbi:hypothetical protein OsI_23059 [Oryza sativa Indica Group]|uniref:F-box domain-containing protein n=1 Tax=Oryza sativa subsp. indica TaxID=39946 RepID=A2YD64_ORYSI|nr:hypothetical protein OsI_23059 [Oryza sativa Indica Group]